MYQVLFAEDELLVRPDVVITDIRMEGMDGCELIEKIREQDKDCAIIVISCLDNFEILRKMIPYKIIGYVLKASMTMDEVNEILAKTTEQRCVERWAAVLFLLKKRATVVI